MYKISEKYKYILIDEFQDTNKVQLDLIKLISSQNNITIVGDQKQSIYNFRGANLENLEICELGCEITAGLGNAIIIS